MPKSPVFDELVGDGDDPLGMVAYGLYKKAKCQWLEAFEAKHARSPTADELAAYVSTWTPQLIETTLESARSALAAFASEAIDEARPSIVEDALKGNWLKSVGLSLLSAFLYTLLLLGAALVLKAAGIDLLGVVQAVGPNNR